MRNIFQHTSKEKANWIHYSTSMLSWQLNINSTIEFAVCEAPNFLPAWQLAWHEVYVRLLNMLECGKCEKYKCMQFKMYRVFCFSTCILYTVLSHASLMTNFKHGKLLDVRNWLKQVPWQLHAKQPRYYSVAFLSANSMWMYYSFFSMHKAITCSNIAV